MFLKVSHLYQVFITLWISCQDKTFHPKSYRAEIVKGVNFFQKRNNHIQRQRGESIMIKIRVKTQKDAFLKCYLKIGNQTYEKI
jgi:hypothetical protein